MALVNAPYRCPELEVSANAVSLYLALGLAVSARETFRYPELAASAKEAFLCRELAVSANAGQRKTRTTRKDRRRFSRAVRAASANDQT